MGKRGGTEKETRPFSIRLTQQERQHIEQAAGNLSLGAYIRSRILDEAAPRRRTRNSHRAKDREALGRLLGELGRSRIANNLDQLARASHSGSLPVTPETENDIRSACTQIAWMRSELMKALGLLRGESP